MRRLGIISALLCSLAYATRGDDPLVNAINETIYQIDLQLMKNHLDVVDISNYSYSGFLFGVDIVKGTAGNFSTTSLIGTPFMNETDTSTDEYYYFDIDCGVSEFNIEAEYKAKILKIFSSSGTLQIKNTGAVVDAKGYVKCPKSGSCEVVTTSVSLKEMGDLDIAFKESSVAHWILQKIMRVAVRIATFFDKSVLNEKLKDISEVESVKNIITSVTCGSLGC